MLMGLPGAGKSTFRKQFAGQCVSLSTDDLIEDAAAFKGLTYSEAFADEIKPATASVQAAFKQCLRDGANIMWDQTNLTPKKRKGVLAQVPDTYHKAVVWVTCDEDERQKRLKNRPGKVIPAHVDASMIENMTAPTLDEGWDEIVRYRA
jgi:predicted kinase